MPIQDGQNIGSWLILGGERMRTHRYREILCSKSDQQATNGGPRAHGQLDCGPDMNANWADRESQVRNEIAVLKKVSMGHQNILTLVDYFETMNNRMSRLQSHSSPYAPPIEWKANPCPVATVYLVTDLALGGELFDRICRKGSYYESDAADLIRATLSAVAYLHDHGIVHRDLKPENLLFRTPEDNADLLIADFGLSRIMDEEQFHVLTTTCGTPGYMAPEIFKKTGHGKPV
jgi:calcium/calmodulin-dependent protein kinase I